MRRRDALTLMAGAAVAGTLPLAVRAQQPRRIGVLMNTSATSALSMSYVAAFVQGLGQIGWVDGQNIRLDLRWNAADASLSRLYAAQLIGLQPDVILTASTTNLANLRDATNTIPIVFVQVSDPVAQGFVVNLTRPGGNLTGFSAFDFSIGGKWVDLLKQISPELARVAVVFNPDSAPQTQFFLRSIEIAAQALGVGIVASPVRTFDEFESMIKHFVQQPNGGLIFPTGGFLNLHQKAIIQTALRYRLPAVGANNLDFARDGGLMYYGYAGETIDQYRQAASYVDRILKGAKPGDLPVQLASKYVLVINMKTARALGLTVPITLLGLADQVIE
jgi:putative ABC transport system substrate-binding protein